MGKNRRFWTAEQKEYIKDMIVNHKMNYIQAAEMFNKKFNENRSAQNIRNQAHYIGVKADRINAYTKEEEQFVADLVSNTDMNYLQITQEFNKKFNTNKTSEQLIAMASRRGIKKVIYTEEEKQFIVDLATNTDMKYSQITQEFNKKFNENKNEKQMRGICSYWGIKRDYKFYTEEEKNFIIEMIVDEGMDYYTLTPIFNKKFNKNKTRRQLGLYGCTILGIKCNDFLPRSKRDNFSDVERKRIESYRETKYLNQEPLGTIKYIVRGRGKQAYIKIKMIPEDIYNYYSKEVSYSEKIYSKYWYPYDKYVYEQHYNVKLKENEYIQHIDGNLLNNDISNLICVSYSALQFSVKNGYYYDPEIRSIGFKLGELRHLIKEGENK